jgi:ribonuclease HI
VVDDLKKGYYLLFIDGGKRANEEGQAEGAIGAILQEPDCGPVLATVAEKVGPVGSPQEAEYVAAFSDSAHVVNQITRRWNKNERATELCEEVEEALAPFKAWQLSGVPRAMNREADKLVDHAFKGEPVIHASDAEGSGTEIVADAPPPKKAASWREGSPAEMAEYLHCHQTIRTGPGQRSSARRARSAARSSTACSARRRRTRLA